MLAPWNKSYDQPRQHIKKQRHYFTSKGPPSHSYGFSGSHVWMWELDHKESWAPKNWCFLTVMFKKTLESPLDYKEIQSVLCDATDGSPPGSPVPGILQARTLEWVAISFSNAGEWKVKVKSLSRVRLLATPWTEAYQAPPSMGFSRQEYWSGVPLPSPDNPLSRNLIPQSSLWIILYHQLLLHHFQFSTQRVSCHLL